ncbi:hypoxanthine-guanine phosphoribosyltransferase [Pseudomonas aeruginosa]|nr:hypoxanthine-guanine phosphoribosyltransferase [Pseudomonas aeruginosa]BAP53153.1 hypoxanthine-guanine phosphoribosyltransferase [Pseudomonas aeruginosa]
MSRVFISPLATPFHSLVSIFPIPSRYISIFRAPPPRYFSPSLMMNGGLIFSGKLLPLLDFPLELSYLHATRYRNETSGGELFWKAKPEISFIDRDVLIIDDILDEGHTLSAIIDFCKHAGARAVHTAVLVDKEHERKARPDLKASFTGLYCADRYVFGYGMDYKGYWRNAAGIFAVKGL